MRAAFNTRPTDLAPETQNLAVTISGSFHRHLHAINAAVQELASRGVRVLSPADPRIVAAQGEFLFVASDRVRSVRLVQDRHLDCIRAASFLWLVCPDGYVGQSASMEIGAAVMAGVPIYAMHAPVDLTLRQYVTVVHSLKEALRIVAASSRPRRPEGLLINPHASLEEAHDALIRVGHLLTSQTGVEDSAGRVQREIASVYARLAVPTPVQ